MERGMLQKPPEEECMKQKTAVCVFVLCALPAIGQDGNPTKPPAPIYKVTVVERTTKAINYRYRSGPTEIDFRGTVLLPQGKGSATVESKQGRTEIDARFEKLTAPGRFGREYLTYVLWALTPDGRPHNLGEIVADSSDKGSLHATTDLQAFALIVTAEPYSAVRQPTDVVVLENAVRNDTSGNIEEVQANYSLLPRGQYTWNMPANLESETKGHKVSMKQYEMLTEIYQAQNAVDRAFGQRGKICPEHAGQGAAAFDHGATAPRFAFRSDRGNPKRASGFGDRRRRSVDFRATKARRNCEQRACRGFPGAAANRAS